MLLDLVLHHRFRFHLLRYLHFHCLVYFILFQVKTLICALNEEILYIIYSQLIFINLFVVILFNTSCVLANRYRTINFKD